MTTEYSVLDGTVDGRDTAIRVRDYVPAQHAGGALLWVHGGAFRSGGLDQRESDAPARALASSGRWVRTVDYRLVRAGRRRGNAAPEAGNGRFPAAHHDVVDVAEALAERSGSPIFLGGASAGANLAAGAALALRDRSADGGTSCVRGLVLAYGVFHAELPSPPEVERQLRGPLVRWLFNPKMTRRMNLNYVGDEALLTPGYAFPGGADLTGLPPAFVLDARQDRLRCSGHVFAEELRRASVPVHERVIDGRHGFLDRPKGKAYGEGIEALREWLRDHDADPSHG